MISEIDNELEKTYSYDRRGNMTEVSIGGKMVKQFTFDAANRMSSSAEIVSSLIKKAEYRYNALGQRVGQDIWRMGKEGTDSADILSYKTLSEKPEEKIRYTIDLTRVYHNMLCLETKDKNQTFYWDDNVTAMEESGMESYYVQDVLGSPMYLMDERGKSRELYGYDEFGLSLNKKENVFQNPLQPFGFTGYQMDEAGGLYFAQARRYDAGLGRFISEDFIKGFIEAPFTLNNYGYCWNRPLDLVDLNGLWPTWVKVAATVAFVAGVAVVAAVAVPAIGAAAVAAGITTTATIAAVEATAAAVVTVTVAGAAVGGVVGGVSNVITDSGSFVNGFCGGAINGAISSLGTWALPRTFYAAGGAAGSLVTDYLNNSDKSAEEQKSLMRMGESAVVAGGTQFLIGGMLNTVWSNATGGWSVANTVGSDRLATILWQSLFDGGFSLSTGSLASITWDEVVGGVDITVEELKKPSDDNFVKE